MKTIVILLLITLSFAFIPERSFLQQVAPEIVQDKAIEEPIKEAPRLQRQNAIRIPLSDLEDSTDAETSDSDSFQVDQTYLFGPKESFTDIYNEWNKENLANEPEKTEPVEAEEILVGELVKESIEQVEVTVEDLFDEVMVALKELSKEAEEKKTILGMDKASFKEIFESAKGDFFNVFDQVLTQMTEGSNGEMVVSDVDKEAVKEALDELEENADEVFDNTLSVLTELAKESTEKDTLFGFGKGDIKKFFGQIGESFEKLLDGVTLEIVEFSDEGDKEKVASESDSGAADESVSDIVVDLEVDLDEVLLAVRNLFNETVEEKALFGQTSENDTLSVDNTYFNGLGVEVNQDSADVQVDFDKVFAALSGLVNQVIENEKLLETEKNE